MTSKARWYCNKKHRGCKDIEFIPTKNKRLLVFKDYTYFMMHSDRRWYCSSKRSGCKAIVIFVNEVVHQVEEHNHNPPNLVRNRDESRLNDTAFLRYYRQYRRSNPEKFVEEKVEVKENPDPVATVSGLLDFLLPNK
ncbi:unnamed protein product [Pieris brassicae]|uniref:FLYWCH-type domain-containing protein n=1 Tax=Pieris brassicae TaxID=7116 RepID=A0A9P0SRK0_PIEBR|nr:unnamed protein product [Pieris brassicae]